MMFSSIQADSPENQWRYQLDRFVKNHQQELAALTWGLWLENGSSKGTIGVDLQPKPHFVYCPQAAVENLNDQVDNKLQEVLGIIEHYNPEVEVLMIGIAKDQIKLVYFEPEIAPPVCFKELGKSINLLLESLEQKMAEQLRFDFG
ncbi:beta-carboxysome assembly chaperone CcmS [Mastigocoleus testarum]|uniref:Chaperone protein CcmS domain-containing protein n=2 Tax=Mastigocoleus TaxID=996924 RepID=A0A0V7ZZN7_9CYAN|nr:hypothetical protein [Mastigocoleus testarum]KST70021.1 hypothetical protein BC008_06165 [Mastigocoleus testarum BC008]